MHLNVIGKDKVKQKTFTTFAVELQDGIPRVIYKKKHYGDHGLACLLLWSRIQRNIN